MMKYAFTIVVLFVLASCRKTYDVQLPDTHWDLFDSPSAVSINHQTGNKIQGVYELVSGAETFGSKAAAKWTYTAHGTDTTYYLSFYCQKDIAYFICEGKSLDSALLLNGYWRKMASTEAGKIRLTISKSNGGTKLLSPGELDNSDSILIEGNFGSGDNSPNQPIKMRYIRQLNHAPSLEMVVHRGGGQTADLLPASENTTQIIEMASRFGATGIEIDVRLTKDGVPILYHDVSLSERLIQKNGMVGPIENYTYAQLNALVRLIRNGERIPTLRDALETAVYNTPLQFVWMDIKFHGSLKLIRELQAEYIHKAATLGRTIDINIGIPDEEVLNQFLSLPNYQQIPSVCELEPMAVARSNAHIWAPRWTLGLQNDEVQEIHTQGRKAFIWTLDIPQNIEQFMTQGHFDGILSNYPSAVAYLYYVKE